MALKKFAAFLRTKSNRTLKLRCIFAFNSIRGLVEAALPLFREGRPEGDGDDGGEGVGGDDHEGAKEEHRGVAVVIAILRNEGVR